MKTVGVRALKNQLSEYLRQVRSGERLLVIDRGEIIAEITRPKHPITDTDVPPALLALERRGLAALATARETGAYSALPRTGKRKVTAAQFLEAERGSQ